MTLAAPPPARSLLDHPVGIDLYEPEAQTHPARVETVRVAAVSPCYNRLQDVVCLFEDLSRLDRAGRIDLVLYLVDNASSTPLSTVAAPPDLNIVHVRNESNDGGAGGFNSGMRAALAGHEGKPFDYIWLIDSDARATPGALRRLLETLEENPRLAAVGSALRDPLTGITFEVGGLIDRRKGHYMPAAYGRKLQSDALIYCDYLAACSALIRREALEASGLMPEVFLNGDDVDLFVNLRQKTGLLIAGDPRSVVYHPWRKFQIMARYFIARNSFAPIDRLGLGGLVRFRRACLEVGRAVAQTMMSAEELAELHLRGMADAAAGRIAGPMPPGTMPKVSLAPFSQLASTLEKLKESFEHEPSIFVHPYLALAHAGLHDLRARIEELDLPVEPTHPWVGRNLGQKVRRELCGAMRRLILGPAHDIAIVPTGWPTGWFRGRIMIEVATDGFLVKKVHRWRNFFRGIRIAFTGWYLALRIALRGPRLNTIPPARPPTPPTPPAPAPSPSTPGNLPVAIPGA